MGKLLRVAFAAGLAAAGSQAQAAWYEACSRHFVIYADEDPKELAELATRIERFDQAARLIRNMDDPPVGLGNRLTVYVLPSLGTVQKLANGNRHVGGFYTGRATGSSIFVPRRVARFGSDSGDTERVFFHEYAHHLMFQNVDRPLPEWIVEGFAEFMSTVRFEKNGDIGIGAPANHRARSLLLGDRLPLETMLSGNYSKISPELRESVYSRGWLLIHYLAFDKSRAGQLDRYADLLSKGMPGVDAAQSAFGDLKQLDKELDAYLHRNMEYLRLPGARFEPGKIDVRPLSDGAAKVILLRVQSRRGVNQKTAEPLAQEVREVEARYPGDKFVELTLAEAEIDSGNVDASEAAADRVLKADPKNTKAIVFKARAIAARAKKMTGQERHAGFEQARHLFVAANKIDTEDPEPLMRFYGTFAIEGVAPTANAIAALHYASDLAPQDKVLRLSSALQYLRDGKTADAKRALAVIAYDPHGQQLGQFARAIIEKIDAGDEKGALAAAVLQSSSSTAR